MIPSHGSKHRPGEPSPAARTACRLATKLRAAKRVGQETLPIDSVPTLLDCKYVRAHPARDQLALAIAGRWSQLPDLHVRTLWRSRFQRPRISCRSSSKPSISAVASHRRSSEDEGLQESLLSQIVPRGLAGLHFALVVLDLQDHLRDQNWRYGTVPNVLEKNEFYMRRLSRWHSDLGDRVHVAKGLRAWDQHLARGRPKEGVLTRHRGRQRSPCPARQVLQTQADSDNWSVGHAQPRQHNYLEWRASQELHITRSCQLRLPGSGLLHARQAGAYAQRHQVRQRLGKR